MPEYIEREAVVGVLNRFFRSLDGNEAQVLVSDIKHSTLELPAADVVEVVRCKDCKHHHWEQEPCHGKTEYFCSVLNAQVFADFYCYHGAKMDGRGEGE